MTKYQIKDEDGKVNGYLNTDSATFLAANGVLNQNSCTRNTSVFMTPRSKRFFFVHRTMWQGESNTAEEIEKSTAIDFVKTYAEVDEANEILEKINAEKIEEIQ